ncbi:MAG: M28 family peptidase [Sphingomicrobium sp.]
MMGIRRKMAIAAAFGLLGGCMAPLPIAMAPPPPLQMPDNLDAGHADMARMSAVARVLSDDRLMGRAPGGPGEQGAVDYLIAQFREAGLAPAGENGSWVQAVPLVHTQLSGPVVASVRHQGSTRPLTWGSDYSLNTSVPAAEARIADAPLVFVGYGVSAAERGWDDFKGADLKGKVLLMLVNDPDFEAVAGDDSDGRFGGIAMTYYGRWVYKFEEAARQGAAGVLIIHQSDAAGYGWQVASGGARGENFSLDLLPGAPRPPVLQGWIQGPVAAGIVKSAGFDLDILKRAARRKDFRPVDLHTTFSASSPVSVERIASQNVLGKLDGRSRPNEFVSFGGHWDAHGVGKPDAQGRTIRAGALDDALGLAAMIEVARRFVAGPRPERSLLFTAWTAEESGLLGSEYYAQHPTVPLAKMVANLTFDTLQPNGATNDVVLIGKGQSEMETVLAEEAAKQGRSVSIEGHPERGLFFRADHFSLAKRGVPVLLSMALAGAYDMKAGGRAAGEQWLSDFTANCYHQPCDAWSPTWNLDGAQQEADLFFAIGERLANGRAWPRWLPASEFAKVRAASDAERH